MALGNVALPNGAEKKADAAAAAADSVLRTVVEYAAAVAAFGAAVAGETEDFPTDWSWMETWAGTSGDGGLILLHHHHRNGNHHRYHHARRTE